jgi:MinD-like ATPase involved in chromosome partitioning or flagellar assembly
MAVPVLLAVTGAPWEADVVRRTERAPNVRVVRRCVDVPDLLAAAATGQARAVVLAEDLPRLTADSVAMLHARRIAVLALIDPDEPAGEDRLARIGIERILPADVAAEDLARAIADAVESGPPATTAHFAGGFVPQTGSGPPPVEDVEELPGTGRLLAVWGPTGAPGRTTVAIGLAAELAARGVSTLLADADVYGGTVAQALGMLDETSGLAAAARSAGGGSLDVPVLARQSRQLNPHLLVLTGLSRADRWTELRPTAIASVWSVARALAPCTVADAGFCLESDEEISFDTMAPRRNGATLVTLEEADEVVVVGSADPVGLTRLIRAIHELRAVVPSVATRVVVNRVRSGPLGPAPADSVAQALGRYAGVQPAALLPFDQVACDVAVTHGSTLVEAARSSRLRRALQQFAAGVAGDLLK